MADQPPESGTPSPGDGPDAADLSGSVLAGRYQIVRRLGMGGMGAVYLGEHLRMGRKDAIKVLRVEMAQDQETIARFTRGARAVARIRHPNVCQVYDFGETEDGLLFLAMEFIEGPSLSELLAEEGRLKPERAIRFIRQAGEALHAAHESGIIHRDLKPDNMMVARGKDGSEQLKVVDFDIARGTEEEGAGVTRQGFVVGTPEYMSPEQLTGDTLDARSDIYSLALVLFRALAGRLPFEGTTAQELMMQRLSVEPLRLSQAAPGRTFPRGLEAAIHQALSKLPDERPDSARDFVRQVSSTLEGTAAVPPSPQDEATRVAPAAAAPTPPADDDATRVAPAAAAGTGAEASPEAIPGTRVTQGSGETPGVGDGARRRRALILGGSGVGLIAVIAAGWLVVASGADSPEVAEDISTDPIGEVAQGADAGADDPDEGPEAATDDPQETQATGTAAAADREAAQADPPPPTVEEDPEPETPTAVAGARPVTLPAGDSRGLQQITFDQYVLQAEARGPTDIQAARDTAAAVWAVPGATRPDRAFAAHVLGLTLISLGDSIQGVDWLEEAVRLDPLDRYVGPLEAHRRPGR